MSTSSQGKLVGSRGAMFRKTSTSKPDDWKDHSGKDVGAARNYAHEKAAVAKSDASKAKKERDIIDRTKAAAKRAKETLRMAKEEISEAKKFVYDKPHAHLVKMYDKKPTEDLKGMHSRWSADHKDKKSNPSRSEDLLAVHHILKSRGQNPVELPQHKNLGMSRMHEETGTEARVKIKNVARPDDAEPTSEKSKLSKQAEIKTKIIEERPTMSKIDFGLSSSLINATKSIMEKKHAKEAKTEVDLDPETNDKLDDENGDDDDDVKKESKKHTTPKSDKEKKLASLAHPKDKITHKDVLVGRGVLKKEETEIEEAIKPYVSYSGPRPGKSPSATVMAAGEKPHKTFSKDEHGADYKQKAMDYFKKNMKKLHSEEVEEIEELEKKTLGSYITKVASLSPEKVKASREAGIEKATKKYKMKEEVDIDSLTEEQLEEVLKKSDPAGKWVSDFVHSKDPKFAGKSKKERMKQALGAYYAKQRNEEVELTAEELERIESIAAQLDEAKPTIVSAPIRGANQDQSGFGVKKNTADYTISDDKKVRKEEVELDEAASFRVPAHVKKHLEDKHGPAQTILVSKDGSKIQHVVRHHDDDGADYYETRTHEYNGTAPIKDRKVGKLIKHVKPKLKEEVELEEGRGRPKKSGDEAEGDDTHKHPIQQLTKISHAIEGSEPHFEHKDGAKTKVGKHLAKHVMAVYSSMRTSQEKDDFANKLHASKDSMKSAVSKLF